MVSTSKFLFDLDIKQKFFVAGLFECQMISKAVFNTKQMQRYCLARGKLGSLTLQNSF